MIRQGCHFALTTVWIVIKERKEIPSDPLPPLEGVTAYSVQIMHLVHSLMTIMTGSH